MAPVVPGMIRSAHGVPSALAPSLPCDRRRDFVLGRNDDCCGRLRGGCRTTLGDHDTCHRYDVGRLRPDPRYRPHILIAAVRPCPRARRWAGPGGLVRGDCIAASRNRHSHHVPLSAARWVNLARPVPGTNEACSRGCARNLLGGSVLRARCAWRRSGLFWHRARRRRSDDFCHRHCRKRLDYSANWAIAPGDFSHEPHCFGHFHCAVRRARRISVACLAGRMDRLRGGPGLLFDRAAVILGFTVLGQVLTWLQLIGAIIVGRFNAAART